jgi:hypothetical protein
MYRVQGRAPSSFSRRFRDTDWTVALVCFVLLIEAVWVALFLYHAL